MGSNSAPRVPFRKRLWRWKWAMALAIVVLAALGWYGYQQLQIHNQYEQFIQAKNDLHSLSQDIIAAVGQPAQHKATQTCGYTSQEFSRGARFCDVDELFIYHVQDHQEAQELANKISNASDNSILTRTYRNDDYLPSGTLIASSFTLAGFSQCGLQAALFSNKDEASSYSGFLFDGQSELSVDLNCSGSALSEYFEVQN